MNTTFSWQVPTTEIEFGPAAGSDARAALIDVKAPGVAPEQSTTAPAAKAAPDNSTRHTPPASNLSAEAHSFMVFLSFVRVWICFRKNKDLVRHLLKSEFRPVVHLGKRIVWAGEI